MAAKMSPRTDIVFCPISEVSEGTVSLIVFEFLQFEFLCCITICVFEFGDNCVFGLSSFKKFSFVTIKV